MSPDERAGTQAAAGSYLDDSSSTPERILQAVIDGLTELDPAALTIQQVCRRAGVTAPTLYYHFGSKDGLTAAAVDSMVSRWLVQFDEIVDRSGTLDEALAQAVAGWHLMITARERPFAVFVWLSMWSEESRVTLLRAREQAQRLIRDALADHLGDASDLDDLAGMLLDGVLGASVDYQLDSDGVALHRRLVTLASAVRLRADAGEPSRTLPPPTAPPAHAQRRKTP